MLSGVFKVHYVMSVIVLCVGSQTNVKSCKCAISYFFSCLYYLYIHRIECLFDLCVTIHSILSTS